MKRNTPGKTRKIIGTVLVALVIAFTVYLSVIMLQRISRFVLE